MDLPYPETQTSPIHEADIAEAALAVLTRPELRGRSYHLTGPASLSAAEQVAVVAEATGRPISVNAVSGAAWKESMADFIPATVADALLGYFAAHDWPPRSVTTTVEELTGHPARTFAPGPAKTRTPSAGGVGGAGPGPRPGHPWRSPAPRASPRCSGESTGARPEIPGPRPRPNAILAA